jgi:hypothetical protein
MRIPNLMIMFSVLLASMLWALPVFAQRVPVHPAPGPLVGAGLPILVAAGGVYWAVRRFGRKTK